MNWLATLISFVLVLQFGACSSGSSSTGADANEEEIQDPDEDLDIPDAILQYLHHFNVRTDVDGDQIFDVYETHYLNEEGQTLHVDADDDQDGVIEDTTDYIYDDAGHTLQLTSDGMTIVMDTHFSYDENGNQIEQLVDSGNNGTIDWAYRSTYNAQNKRTRLEYDIGNDGVPNVIYIWTYDVSGLLETRYEIDSDADGLANYYIDKLYDGDGRLTEEDSDTNGDGSYNTIVVYTYNAEGQMTTSLTDSNADGTYDYLVTYVYDENGNRIQYSSDYGNDGSVDAEYVSEYALIPDAYTDGPADEFESGDYYVSHFQLFSSGVLDMEGFYIYTEDGSEYSENYDYDVDGVIDEMTAYRFDANGYTTEYFEDAGNDGVYEYHSLYENFYEDLSE